MSRRFGFVAAALVLFATTMHASWMRRYETLQSAQRIAIAALPNAGYVMAVNGSPNLKGSPNAIVTLEADGRVRAARKLDGYDTVFLTTTPAGEIFAGVRKAPRPSGDPNYGQIVKLKRDLSVAWTRRLAGASTVSLWRGAGTRDGGVIVIGWTASGSIVIKLSSKGDVEWSSHVNPTDRELLHSIVQARDGGYIAAGTTPRWPWVVRLRPDGTLLWQKAFGPFGGAFQSVAESSDGTIVLLGTQGGRPSIVKTTASGELQWIKAAPLGYGHSVVTRTNGLIASFSGDRTMHFVSLAPDGTVKWQRTFRPPDYIFNTNGFENAMLAPAPAGVAFAIAFGTAPASMFELDAQGTISNCAWITGGGMALQNATLRPENVPVEFSAPSFKATPADVALSPLEITAIAENCVAADLPAWMKPPPPPQGKTLAFRSADDDTAQRQRYRELLRARKFSELDEIGDRLRREHPSRDPMRPNLALATFYQSFTDERIAPVEQRLSLLREWRAARPQSITSGVALALALLNAADKARGTGYSNTVTGAAWAQHGKLTEESKRVIDSVGARGEIDPEYWAVRISHASDEGGPQAARKVGLQALARHTDPELAYYAASFQYAIWGGSPELYMAFADEATRVTRAKYGDGMYLWLVYQIQNHRSSNDFRQYKIDWARVLKGSEDIIRLNPKWLPSYHRMAKLAERYKDQKTARALFLRPELEWYEDAALMWADRGWYESVRRWALEKPKP